MLRRKQTPPVKSGLSRDDVREEARFIKKYADELLKLLPLQERMEPITSEIAVKMLEVRDQISARLENLKKQVDEILPLAVPAALSEGSSVSWDAEKASREVFFSQITGAVSTQVLKAMQHVKIEESIFNEVIGAITYCLRFLLEYLAIQDDLRNSVFSKMKMLVVRDDCENRVSIFTTLVEFICERISAGESVHEEVQLGLATLELVRDVSRMLRDM